MDIVEAARLFNVKSNQPHIFWALQAYVTLPLPEYWAQFYDPQNQIEVYYSLHENVRITARPCYSYIMDLILNLYEEQKEKPEMAATTTKVILCDKLGRSYDIDIGALIRDTLEQSNQSKRRQIYHYMLEDPQADSNKKAKKIDITSSKFIFNQVIMTRLQRCSFY